MDVTRSNRDLNELHPKVKELAEKLIEEGKKQGINIGISETYRSPERQDYLYAQGRTRPGRIVTWVKGSDMASYHQWRLAFDTYNNVKGKEYDVQILNRIGAIGQKLGLEWGGGWSGFKDSPHFQYTFGLSIKDLRKGKCPPGYEPKKEEIDKDEEYEQSIIYLKSIGLINTFEAWYPEPTTKYFELLLENMMPELMKHISYEYAIQILKLLGIITSTEIWLNRDFRKEYMQVVIKRIVAILDDENKYENDVIHSDYEKAVNYLRNKGLINTLDAWIPNPSGKYFDILLSNLMPSLVKEVSFEYHIQILKEIGIISSTQIWLNRDFRDEYIKILIKRIVEVLKK